MQTPSTPELSKRVAAAEAEILRLARSVVPNVRAVSVPTQEFYSCTLVVASDEEKRRINEDAALLQKIIMAAELAGRKPDFLAAESQESVDRRWNGDWSHVWR